MPEIDDTGTIWIRGRVRPEYGVRVGESYFITGKEDAESIECRVDEKYLWVDLHDADKRRRRIFRKESEGTVKIINLEEVRQQRAT